MFWNYNEEGDGEESGLLAGWLRQEGLHQADQVLGFFEVSNHHLNRIAESKKIISTLEKFKAAYDLFRSSTSDRR